MLRGLEAEIERETDFDALNNMFSYRGKVKRANRNKVMPCTHISNSIKLHEEPVPWTKYRALQFETDEENKLLVILYC